MSVSEQEFLSGLHQLIKNIEPVIKSSSGSLESAEDAILHLEETDESFHKYVYNNRTENSFVLYNCK